MTRQRPWWQWVLVGITIIVLAWGNVLVWTSFPSPAEVADQALEELRRVIQSPGR